MKTFQQAIDDYMTSVLNATPYSDRYIARHKTTTLLNRKDRTLRSLRGKLRAELERMGFDKKASWQIRADCDELVELEYCYG